ncbi:GNAT family protein [Cytobacillus sp. S13-E01]|uniref:GNAT family N-acetyltransferase n=1 Tax=Cytobacillus sp. S13-E01 TaxID=3031326 RepID=UPI0023D8170F|nr:GNAT family protein [Cytobacillus sp. S13-E01]MDF0727973.1 GNAT family protein [Cytobacillus sp. S13-E01]
MELVNDEAVYETGFMGYSYPLSNLQVENMLNKWLTNENKQYVIKFDSVEIGIAQISNIDHSNRVCEVGVLLLEEGQNKGIGHWAFQELTKICFDRLDMYRIEARVKSNNIAASKILDKLNFSLDGVLRKTIYFKGDRIDLQVFGLLQDQYKSVKQKLQHEELGLFPR